MGALQKSRAAASKSCDGAEKVASVRLDEGTRVEGPGNQSIHSIVTDC
jgi:hypothetical protein